MTEFSKDRWYWIRLKFGTTAIMAKPHTINSEGLVTSWSAPWLVYMTPINAKDYVVLAEVPFPEGYDPRR